MSKGLPSHIIKKYGMTKKAWQVFRSSSGSKVLNRSQRSKTKRRSVPTMAKKRHFGRKASGVSVTKALMGGFGVVIADQLLSQLGNKLKLGISDEIVKFGVGIYFSKKPGMIGEGAKALAYINAAKLLSGINIGNILGGSTSTGTANSGW